MLNEGATPADNSAQILHCSRLIAILVNTSLGDETSMHVTQSFQRGHLFSVLKICDHYTCRGLDLRIFKQNI